MEPGLLVANDDPRVHRQKGNEGKRTTTGQQEEKDGKRDCDNPKKNRGEKKGTVAVTGAPVSDSRHRQRKVWTTKAWRSTRKRNRETETLEKGLGTLS